ncbi:MAG: MMPL family transporter [Myxococcales bacterium]|nr:MMPL family transporter [Myxococcales bacterium]
MTAPSSDRPGLVARYTHFAVDRPRAVLAVLLISAGLLLWYGAGIGVRSNIEALFPDNTPAVLAAQRARTILPSSNQMTIVFGSPSRQQNRRLAQAFCERAEKLPEVASVDCRRDIDFFRRNATLFLSTDELKDIEKRAVKSVKEAVARNMLGAGFEGGGAPAGDDFDDEDEDDEFGDDDEDEEPTAAAAQKPGAQKPPAKTPKQPEAPKDAAKAEKGFTGMLDDEALAKKLGASHDIREWVESDDGSVLGVKLFPRVSPSDVDASARFTKKIEGILASLKPQSFHPKMLHSMHGDYNEVAKEVENLRSSLVLTTFLALFGIIMVQLLAYRRLRALLLLFVPLIVGVAWTMAFARLSVGSLNMVTAFVFAILFGLGTDFGVYTLSRYFEYRSQGANPRDTLIAIMPELWLALRTAAITTAAAFLALVALDFRGFSQFGLLAGVGVLLALVATIAVIPPLAVVLHQMWPEKDVPAARADGLRWIGLFASPKLARLALLGAIVLAVVSVFSAQHIGFETNLRKLRTPPKKSTKKAKATQTSATHRLGYKYRSKAAKGRAKTPILVIADTMENAGAVHAYLQAHRDRLTRMTSFVSIHTFVPSGQAEKIAAAQRIRNTIVAKIDAMGPEDKKEAERALEMLSPKAFSANDLPDFVRKRFLDVDGKIGRYVLIYANGNLADAGSVKEVIAQLGMFEANGKKFRATASYFILAEADNVVRKEGPIAVLLAALAVLLVIGVHFRSLRMVATAFVPLVLGFIVFLGLMHGLGMELNLFSITVLPSIFGIAIDGTVHIVHRANERIPGEDLRLVLQRVAGAAWIAALTTVVGFGALIFQDNPGMQSIASTAALGILVVCTLANVWAGSLLALAPSEDSASGVTPV